MKKLSIILFAFVISLSCYGQNSNNDEAKNEEAKIEELKSKSYTQRMVLPQYLKVYRLYTSTSDKHRILQGVSDLVQSTYTILNADALILDTIQDLAYSEFKNDDAYLPILEKSIIKMFTPQDKYLHSFEMYDRAISIRTERNLLKGQDYEVLLRWYADHLVYNKKISNTEKLDVYKKLWTVYQENCGQDNKLDERLLQSYIFAASHAKEYSLEVDLLKIKEEYLEKTGRKESKEWYSTQQFIYYAYSNLAEKYENDETKALEYRKKEIEHREICVRHLMETSITSTELSSDISSFIFSKLYYGKDTISARAIANEYANLISEKVEENSELNLKALESIASTYSDQDQEKIPILKRMLSIEENLYGTDDIRYKATASALNLTHYQNHDMSAAIEIASITTNDDDPMSLMNLSSQQYQYGKYKDAIETSTKLLEYSANHPETKFTYLFISALNIVNCNVKLRDCEALISFARKWSTDSRFSYEDQKFIFTNSIGQASLLGVSGDKIINVIDEFISKNATTANEDEHAEMEILKANVLYGLRKFSDAEAILSNLVDRYTAQTNADIRKIITYRIYQEICLAGQGEYEKAKQLNSISISQIKNIPGYETTAEYGTLCCRACYYENLLGNIEESNRYANIVHEIAKKEITSLSPMTSTTAFNSGVLQIGSQLFTESSIIDTEIKNLCKLNELGKAKTLLKKYVEDMKSTIKFTFSQLDRTNITNNDSYISNTAKLISMVASASKDISIIDMAYNFELLYKQAFLAAEIAMRQQIMGSGNEGLKQKFTSLQSLRTQIQTMEKLGVSTDALYSNVAELEAQIKEDAKMYGDFTKGLDATWQDVRSAISEEELAIEFIEYQSVTDGKEKIGALAVENTSSSPELFELCSVEDIAKEPITGSQAISSKIWGKILGKYSNKKKIFFATTGILYSIPIENLPSPSGSGLVSDNHSLYRISSTRELIDRNGNEQISNACILGGLSYDMSVTDMTKTSNPSYRGSSQINQGSLRAAMETIQYLPGSKIEAEGICDILSKNNIKCKMFEGKDGTEDKVLALNGTDVTILHLATHGFYIKSNKNTPIGLSAYNQEDNMMTRSGLFLSGAQNILDGEEIPEGTPDGVLTALEIATLDLHNLSLVTMSACQTAQGDLGGDGVFGLQRGFKKAGAKTILMSLWNVDDNATCKLMTEFYTNWINKKMTKHNALEVAKKSVRETKGWEDPKYWAAFILLDGVK